MFLHKCDGDDQKLNTYISDALHFMLESRIPLSFCTDKFVFQRIDQANHLWHVVLTGLPGWINKQVDGFFFAYQKTPS